MRPANACGYETRPPGHHGRMTTSQEAAAAVPPRLPGEPDDAWWMYRTYLRVRDWAVEPYEAVAGVHHCTPARVCATAHTWRWTQRAGG